VETIIRQTYGYCRLKSVSAGLGCGIGCTLAVSVTQRRCSYSIWLVVLYVLCLYLCFYC